MKKAILTTVVLLAVVWCLCPPIDDNLDFGWVIGELIGLAVIFIGGAALQEYYPENE